MFGTTLKSLTLLFDNYLLGIRLYMFTGSRDITKQGAKHSEESKNVGLIHSFSR